MNKYLIVIFILIGIILYGIFFVKPQYDLDAKKVKAQVDSLYTVLETERLETEFQKEISAQLEFQIMNKEIFIAQIDTKYIYVQKSIMALNADASLRAFATRLVPVPVTHR